ncbi:hypothetical protein DENSPDRAFT_893740 [Dentipellis sp. KUC8613]|nr:hypothetical protein DENSPDRAFT_893740 [Dentipellis sp. KUC8613]
MGLPAGKLLDLGYFRQTTLAGSIIYTFSLFMVSLTHTDKYYQIFLSQGIGMGIGAGMLYVPVMAVQAHHWHVHRPLAMGIVISGSSLGGIFFPIMLDQLFHGSAGYAWGVRASAFIVLALLALANVLMTTDPAVSAYKKAKPDIKGFLHDAPVFDSISPTFINATTNHWHRLRHPAPAHNSAVHNGGDTRQSPAPDVGRVQGRDGLQGRRMPTSGTCEDRARSTRNKLLNPVLARCPTHHVYASGTLPPRGFPHAQLAARRGAERGESSMHFGRYQGQRQKRGRRHTRPTRARLQTPALKDEPPVTGPGYKAGTERREFQVHCHEGPDEKYQSPTTPWHCPCTQQPAKEE